VLLRRLHCTSAHSNPFLNVQIARRITTVNRSTESHTRTIFQTNLSLCVLDFIYISCFYQVLYVGARLGEHLTRNIWETTLQVEKWKKWFKSFNTVKSERPRYYGRRCTVTINKKRLWFAVDSRRYVNLPWLIDWLEMSSFLTAGRLLSLLIPRNDIKITLTLVSCGNGSEKWSQTAGTYF